MSSSNCCFLTCIQISQEAGQMVWYSHLFQNFPQFFVTHTVNKAEVDVFLELSCFLYDPTDVGNLIFGSSALSKSSSNIWKYPVHVLLKPGLEDFEHYFASMWDPMNDKLSTNRLYQHRCLSCKSQMLYVPVETPHKTSCSQKNREGDMRWQTKNFQSKTFISWAGKIIKQWGFVWILHWEVIQFSFSL